MANATDRIDLDRILEIEKQHGLYTDEIQGVRYWVYFRFFFFQTSIFPKILNIGTNNVSSSQGSEEHIPIPPFSKHPFRSVYARLKRLYLLQKKYQETFKNYHSADLLVVQHPRKLKEGNSYRCLYTDFLSKDFSAFTVCKEYNRERLVPDVTGNVLYLDDIDRLIDENYQMKKRLFPHAHKKLLAEIESHLREPFSSFTELFGLNISPGEYSEHIAFLIYSVKKLKDYYRVLLSIVKPRAIAEVVYYENSIMALNEAAKDMGIPVVELQHGTMHSEHIAYQYDHDGVLYQLPDVILTFSEYWNHIAHLPKAGTRLIATGFPHFEDKLKNSISTGKQYKGKCILFISQATIGPELCRLALECARIFPEDQFHFIFKLHPNECPGWQQKYPELAKSGIEVIDRGGKDLYQLFSECNVQIGVYSTAIYEGLGFGLQTIIYDIAHAGSMRPLEKEGYAVFVQNASEIKQLLLSTKNNGSKMQHFWKENARYNIESYFKKIINI